MLSSFWRCNLGSLKFLSQKNVNTRFRFQFEHLSFLYLPVLPQNVPVSCFGSAEIHPSLVSTRNFYHLHISSPPRHAFLSRIHEILCCGRIRVSMQRTARQCKCFGLWRRRLRAYHFLPFHTNTHKRFSSSVDFLACSNLSFGIMFQDIYSHFDVAFFT